MFPGVWGSQISRQSAHEGVEVVSPTHQTSLPQGNILGTNFCYRLNNPRAIVWPEILCQWKNCNDTIGNWTLDLPACWAMPQPTSLSLWSRIWIFRPYSRVPYLPQVWRSGDRIPLVGDIFHASPDRPCGPHSLLYNGYRVFPGEKAAGVWR